MASVLLRASIDGTVAAALAWVVCRSIPKLSAASRTWLWWLVAAEFVVAAAFAAPITLPVLPAELASGPTISTPVATTSAVDDVRQSSALRVPTDADASPLPDLVGNRWLSSTAIDWLIALWAIGIAGLVALLVRAWQRARAILARSQPASPDVRAIVSELSVRLRLGRTPGVRIDDLITTPVLIGAFRPTVVLPKRSLASLPADAQHLAIAHELAHVKRADLLFGWLPALVEIVFFFHPLARIAAREYALSREAACDALVLRRLDAEPATYGRMLMALGVTRRDRAFSIAGAPWSATILKRRLAMLGDALSPSTVWRIVAWVIIVLAIAAVLPFRLTSQPTIDIPLPISRRVVVLAAPPNIVVTTPPPDVAPAPPATAPAQRGQTSANSRFTQTDLVLVDAIVRDASGQPVSDIRQDEFQVLEDGVQQTVEALRTTVGNNASPPYYVLSYRSTNHDQSGRYRKIEVKVGRPGVSITARNGYYIDQDEFTKGTYPEGSPDLVNPIARDQHEAKYTADAMRAKLQGVVVVEAVVGVDGRVDRVRVAQSLDAIYGLDEQAVIAVRQWTFTPGELKGEKVPVLVRLMMSFRLH